MPLVQKTVYIREEDLEAWKVIPNKAEFIHNSLNGTIENNKQVWGNAKELMQPLAETMKPINLCKHGASPKFCKYAKKGVCK